MSEIISLPFNKTIMCGDPHLDPRTPSSRKDDYAEASLEKLQCIKSLMIKNDYKFIVFLGDMFSRRAITFDYLVKVASFFFELKSLGIEAYSIVGNHDISNERLDTLSSHPLGMFFAVNLIKRLDTVRLEVSDKCKVYIHGFDYKQPILPLRETGVEIKEGDYHVCCAHVFYESTFADNITKEDAISLGYNLYYLGHDHQIYKPVQVAPGIIVCRCCSLMRGSSHLYNLERSVFVDGLSFTDQNGKIVVNYNRYDIPVKNADEVFTSKSMSRELSVEGFSVSVRQFLQAIDDLDKTNTGVYEVLENMEIDGMKLPEPILNNCIHYLREFNVVD